MSTKRKVLKSDGNLELIEVEGGGMLFYEIWDSKIKVAQNSDYVSMLLKFQNRLNEPITLDWIYQKIKA